MSKFVKVNTQLRDLTLIKQALEDLKLAYQEDSIYTHIWSGFNGSLPVVVDAPGCRFGFRQADAGAYEMVADDMHLGRLRPLLDQIQQRYAYHAVVQETAKAGFELVEETSGRDRVIRLTVRRWS
jgi:hypothetical protein